MDTSISKQLDQILKDNETLRFENQELVKESIRNRALELEDIGWKLVGEIGQDNDGADGLDLDGLKKISVPLREMAASNPWHIRGAQLRHSYVFGRGMSYSNLKPKAQRAVDDPHNKAVLFSVGAYETINKASFADGAVFILRDPSSEVDKFNLIPLAQISGVVTNPDDASEIWYLKRSWSVPNEDGSGSTDRSVWYPVARYKNTLPKSKVRRTINKTPVDQAKTVYYRMSNRQAGWTWGVPDSFGAMVWTVAYSEALKDYSTLVKSLSLIAWKMTSSTPKGAAGASAQVRNPQGEAGGIASMSGTDLAGVGVPSAQVNMGNVQPLIAAVAASFGVPVIALLSSPGDTGGSYGSAQTLSDPTLKVMSAVQDSWRDFFEEILHDLGSKNASVEFPNIDSDPAYRQVASLAQATQLGLMFREEAREGVLQLVDAPKLYNTLPVPDGFNQYKDPATTVSSGDDPLARQGNSGSVPGGVEQDTTNHDTDNE